MSRGIPPVHRSHSGLVSKVASACNVGWSVSTGMLRCVCADKRSTIIDDELELQKGPRDMHRIHIRGDFEKFQVGAGLIGLDAALNPRKTPLVVEQYSFMAFARFYYNRICSTIEGAYEALPIPLAVTLIQAASATTDDKSSHRSPMSRDRRESSGEGSNESRFEHPQSDHPEGRDPSRSETGPQCRARSMALFRSAITPHHESAVPEVFAHAVKTLPAYIEATEQHDKDRILERARIRTVMFALNGLQKHE
jgi:hypothetical protein